MTANKILFIVLDGISDRPCPELNGLTPLAAAKKPVLDKLAAEGCCGIMDTIAPGIRPGSDTAHLALLGEGRRPALVGRLSGLYTDTGKPHQTVPSRKALYVWYHRQRQS